MKNTEWEPTDAEFAKMLADDAEDAAREDFLEQEGYVCTKTDGGFYYHEREKF